MAHSSVNAKNGKEANMIVLDTQKFADGLKEGKHLTDEAANLIARHTAEFIVMGYGQLATQEYIERKFAELDKTVAEDRRQRQTQYLVFLFSTLGAIAVLFTALARLTGHV